MVEMQSNGYPEKVVPAEIEELYRLSEPLVKYMRENCCVGDVLLITDSIAQIFKLDLQLGYFVKD